MACSSFGSARKGGPWPILPCDSIGIGVLVGSLPELSSLLIAGSISGVEIASLLGLLGMDSGALSVESSHFHLSEALAIHSAHLGPQVGLLHWDCLQTRFY